MQIRMDTKSLKSAQKRPWRGGPLQWRLKFPLVPDHPYAFTALREQWTSEASFAAHGIRPWWQSPQKGNSKENRSFPQRNVSQIPLLWVGSKEQIRPPCDWQTKRAVEAAVWRTCERQPRPACAQGSIPCPQAKHLPPPRFKLRWRQPEPRYWHRDHSRSEAWQGSAT
jgi:hypothetical protein